MSKAQLATTRLNAQGASHKCCVRGRHFRQTAGLPFTVKTFKTPAVFPTISQECIDPFVNSLMTAQALSTITMTFKHALIELVLGDKFSHHLACAHSASKPSEAGNQRNRASAKTLLTQDGSPRVEIRRDRATCFVPRLIAKREGRFGSFNSCNSKTLAMIAQYITSRKIQGFLGEQYGTVVTSEFICSVLETVLNETRAWPAYPLEAVCPVIFFDLLTSKTCAPAEVFNKDIYLALIVLPNRTHDI